MNRPIAVIVSLWGALASPACGHKADAPARTKEDAAPAAAPLAMPVLGVDQIRRFNFAYEAGAAAQDKAIAAYRKKDWPGVRAQAEAAIAKDATHLGAHRLLAAALAQTGEPAAAVDHLVTVLAADYLQYAPTLEDDDLKSFMASPHGQSIAALASKIRDEYARRIAGALWLVGRRSPFKWPKDPGVQTATPRGELYAFDRETRRFFRLTHTEHQVAGFVRAAAGSEVAVVGFDRIDRPKPEGDGDTTPVIAQPWLQIVDVTTWKPSTKKKIALPAAREITLAYAAGDQLLVSIAQATGRWTVGEPAISSVDRTTGQLTRVTIALPPTRLVMSLDEGHLVRVPDGVLAAWTGDPPVTTSLKTAAGKPIQIPESGAAAQASVAAAPDGGHVAFATAVDPCAKDAAPSLYVADAATGTYKHLLSAKSRFPTRWLDAMTLAYEDGEGAIRLWDAQTGRQIARLEARSVSGVEDRSGLALDVLSPTGAPLCKQAPPAVDAAGGTDEPMPPEEPAGGGTAQGSAAGATAGQAGAVTTP